MAFQQDKNLLPQEQLNKIVTQFGYTFGGEQPTVDAQNIDTLPQDKLEVTEDQMVLKRYASFLLPAGPESERPTTTVAGAIRLNTDTNLFESYVGGDWTDVGAGGLEFNGTIYQIEGDNLISNGTFDVNVDGWEGEISWDATNGGRALLYASGDSEAWFDFLVPSAGYYLVSFESQSDTIIATYVLGLGNSDYYEVQTDKFSYVAYLNASGTATFYVGNYFQLSNEHMWFDNVQVYKLSTTELLPSIDFGSGGSMYLTPTTTYIGTSENPGNNLGIGYKSLYSNTIGYDNIVLGRQAFYSNTAGYSNIGIGNNTLYSQTAGYWNIGIGDYALYTTTNSNSNIAIGFKSLYSTTSGNKNITIGSKSSFKLTNGLGNVATGDSALYSTTTGQLNVAIGNSALYSNTTGSTNTVVGASAFLTGTYSNCTAIGYQAQPTDNNQIILGNNSVEILKARNYTFNIDQTVGVAQDGWVLKYNHSTGQIELTAP